MLLGYRKFTIAVGVILIATGLLIWGKITSAEYVQLVTWVTGLYMGGNAASKMAEKTTTPQVKIDVKENQ